ncbi:MAG: antitoxin HicB [Bradyrhizobium sp.]|jgi:predicted RNase H-like HicB family nuclease|nr:antitoxin HicB [Bradyrhizobium sp.]
MLGSERGNAHPARLGLAPPPELIVRTTIVKLEYAVRIDRLADSDGGGYLATVPELPGCMSDGRTPEEARRNVQEAITSWIEAAKEWKQEIPNRSMEKSIE